jgi:hypothetical protein
LVWASFEALFLIDIILNFFQEYQSEEKFRPIRDIEKIVKRYLTSTFLLDFIALIPFNAIFTIGKDTGQSPSGSYNYK